MNKKYKLPKSVINKQKKIYAKKKNGKNDTGRPVFDGKVEEEVLAKLEAAWAIDATDLEACALAEISRDSYYRYLKAHPVVSQRREQLKQKPFLKARQEIINGMSGNPELCLKYLEKKLPKEFGVKQKIDATVSSVSIIEDAKKFSREELASRIKESINLLQNGIDEDVF